MRASAFSICSITFLRPIVKRSACFGRFFLRKNPRNETVGLLPGNVSIPYCVLSIFVLSCNCHLAMAERHCVLNAGGSSLTGSLGAGTGDFSCCCASPDAKSERGDSTMTFEQVVLLLSLIGGAVYVTFQITWTVSHSDDHKKK